MLWGGGGGQGIPVRCFIRFALPCPAASCVGKPTMVVVAVQGPPFGQFFLSYLRPTPKENRLPREPQLPVTLLLG